MKKSRNIICDCGSGKKYKNCCMLVSKNSFFKNHANKIFITTFILFLSWTFYAKYFDAEPTVWCYECNRYVLESSSGHQLEPLK